MFNEKIKYLILGALIEIAKKVSDICVDNGEDNFTIFADPSGYTIVSVGNLTARKDFKDDGWKVVGRD